jgi:hypothetical protein
MGNGATPEANAARRKIETEACEYLAAKVRYEEGKLYWVKCWKSFIGRQVGYLGKLGYWKVNSNTAGTIPLHRLIFFIHHRYLPDIVDHIDGDKENNRIENLRAATNQQNICNSKLYASNKSGHRGIRFKDGSWVARIRTKGQEIHLGTFKNIEDAIAVRKNAEGEYHGEFARN